MKILLFIITFFYLLPTYSMRNMRPLVIAARNRQMQQPQRMARKKVICLFINGQWYEKVSIKPSQEQLAAQTLKEDLLLNNSEPEKKTRVKRDKPWIPKYFYYEDESNEL